MLCQFWVVVKVATVFLRGNGAWLLWDYTVKVLFHWNILFSHVSFFVCVPISKVTVKWFSSSQSNLHYNQFGPWNISSRPYFNSLHHGDEHYSWTAEVSKTPVLQEWVIHSLVECIVCILGILWTLQWIYWAEVFLFCQGNRKPLHWTVVISLRSMYSVKPCSCIHFSNTC